MTVNPPLGPDRGSYASRATATIDIQLAGQRVGIPSAWRVAWRVGDTASGARRSVGVLGSDAADDPVQFRYGRGRVVMTTFRLRPTIGDDPLASAMLLDLIEHLGSERCRPSLEGPIGGRPTRRQTTGPVT